MASVGASEETSGGTSEETHMDSPEEGSGAVEQVHQGATTAVVVMERVAALEEATAGLQGDVEVAVVAMRVVTRRGGECGYSFLGTLGSYLGWVVSLREQGTLVSMNSFDYPC